MMMNTTRESFIFSQMGITLNHCVGGTAYTNKGMFNEAEYFMAMYKWARKQKFWGRFVEFVIGEEGDGTYGPLYYPISQKYIDAGAFATALFGFITSEKGI